MLVEAGETTAQCNKLEQSNGSIAASELQAQLDIHRSPNVRMQDSDDAPTNVVSTASAVIMPQIRFTH